MEVYCQTLLDQVGLIKNKYDDFAEFTGEHFNVFSILRVAENELAHSNFISYLLNTKGSHKQKDIFLKLFIVSIGDAFENENKNKVLKYFNTENSSSKTEHNTGRIRNDWGSGGSIDILINDGKNNIIIENKIGALDQKNQLVRYNNYDNKAALIYLNFEGNEPSDYSKGTLKCGKDFICISYTIHIVDWLEKCIKEMANKPRIRETLNQYLHLVKLLTNQTANNKMKEEIINLIKQNDDNLENAKLIHDNYILAKREMLKEFLKEVYIPFLKRVERKNGLTLIIKDEEAFWSLKQNWATIKFSNAKLESYNIAVTFSFNNASTYKNFIYGINPKTNNLDLDNRIKNEFENEFGNSSSSSWLCYRGFEGYEDWTDLNTLKKLHNLQFENVFEEKVLRVIELIESYLP